MATKVAFIGLGAMGLPMASNLARKGFELVSYDVEPRRMEMLGALGARSAGSAAEAA
jgi:4-hydroxybutyrate dehydrogenase / sulfolactaldehyde 3-reductase